MKKLFYSMVLLTCVSCAGLARINAEIGMTESEFKKKNVGEELAELNERYTVYRVPAGSGPHRYVYFENGKLIKMDEGEWMPNVIIQNR